MMMPLSKLKTPSTAIPANLNGNVSIQKKGYNTRARSASGQQSTNKISQAINVNMQQSYSLIRNHSAHLYERYLLHFSNIHSQMR